MMPNFKQNLEAAQNSFIEDAVTQTTTLSREKGTWTFLQAIVVLEEFTKELAGKFFLVFVFFLILLLPHSNISGSK